MKKVDMKFYRKRAFTLAEVLITMAVVGVVAALTMPTMINNYQKKTYVTALHKAYNETSQALKQVMTDRNSDDIVEAGLTSNAALNTWVKNYFKVQTDCGTSYTPCFAESYSKMKSSTFTGAALTTDYNYFMLPSGASIRPMYAYDATSKKRINLMVDTNGQKGPNILGRDLFFLAIYEDGSIDDFDEAATPVTVARRETLFSGSCDSNDAAKAWGCFGKVLNDGWQLTY